MYNTYDNILWGPIFCCCCGGGGKFLKMLMVSVKTIHKAFRIHKIL